MYKDITHLSSDQIEELMRRYYVGENIKSLLTEYQLQVKPAALAGLFPPIIHFEKFCPYCPNHNLSSKRPSRSNRLHKPPRCSLCGHVDHPFCPCAQCHQVRNIKFQEETRRQRQTLDEAVKLSIAPPAADSLDLELSLYLIAAYTQMRMAGKSYLQASLQYPERLAQSQGLTERIISTLLKHNLVGICETAPLDTLEFSIDNCRIKGIDLMNTHWQILPALNKLQREAYIEAIQIRMSIAWPIAWQSQATQLWREILKDELFSHYRDLLQQRRFYIEQLTDALNDGLDVLLDNFLPAQVLKILFFAARDTADYCQSRKVPSHKSAALLYSAPARKALKFIQSGWVVNGPYPEMRPAIIKHIYFNDFQRLQSSVMRVAAPKEKGCI